VGWSRLAARATEAKAFGRHMPFEVVDIPDADRDKVLAVTEGHFADVKDHAIRPSRLIPTLAALSNAEGREVYIGINEDKQGACCSPVSGTLSFQFAPTPSVTPTPTPHS
jgi:hypothetical protein